MGTTVEERHSDPSQLDVGKWRSQLRSRIKVFAGLIELVATLPGAWCLGLPSPRPAEGVEHRSTAQVEVPFQFFNDNLVIVKATVGAVERVNMILDTGTNPSAISQKLAERLKLPGKTEALQTLNGTIQTQSLILPSMQIGPLEARPSESSYRTLASWSGAWGFPWGNCRARHPPHRKLYDRLSEEKNHFWPHCGK